MTEMPETRIRNKLSQKVSSLSIDKEGLRKLCHFLQERANSSAEIEISKVPTDNLEKEKIDQVLKDLRDGFVLDITIAGINGEELFGEIDTVFDSPNFPEELKAFYVNSQNKLKAIHNYTPRNHFEIFFDFSKPEIFNFSLMPSQSTPNSSNFVVQGYDSTWANGVFSEIFSFIKQRSSPLSIFHRHSIYDILLWVLGFPFGFWVCYKLSSFIKSNFSQISVFFESAIYLYIFVASLFVFRVLFHYLRWVCPLVEFKGQLSKSILHRTILGGLSIAIFGSFIYDLIKLIFK